jgi:hypothetical protein
MEDVPVAVNGPLEEEHCHKSNTKLFGHIRNEVLDFEGKFNVDLGPFLDLLSKGSFTFSSNTGSVTLR